MIKFILIIVAIWLVYTIVIKNKRVGSAKEAQPLENMVRCETCGVHLPEQESIRDDGRFFCSEAHRTQLSS